jgi:AcrR family transcriptional regulator
MASVAHLQTVGGPKQARSEQTQQRLLAAAEELIAAKGHRAVSVPEIARRAGSSVGGFYARFRDKNDLLRALEERHFLELSERVDRLADATRWTDAPLATIVEAAVAELVATTRERHHMIAAFLTRALEDPVILAGGLRFRRSVEDKLSALLLTRRAEMTHPDPPLAIALAIQTAFAIMQQHVLIEETHAGGRALGDAELQREITTLVLRYAGIEPRRRRAARDRRRT